MHRKVAAALVAALVLALAGCGSSERTETVGRAQLVQRLQAACRAGERVGRRELGARPRQVEFMLAQRKSLQTTMDEIDHLEATGSARATFDAYKRTMRTRLDALERIASADRADQLRTMRAELPTLTDAGTQAHGLVLKIDDQLRMICF